MHKLDSKVEILKYYKKKKLQLLILHMLDSEVVIIMVEYVRSIFVVN
jgi:hypothetical protein